MYLSLIFLFHFDAWFLGISTCERGSVKCRIFLQNPILISRSEIERPIFSSPSPSPVECKLFFCIRCIQQLARLADSRVNLSIFHRIAWAGERKTLRRLLISLFFLAVLARYSQLIEKNILFASRKFINSIKTYFNAIETYSCKEKIRMRTKSESFLSQFLLDIFSRYYENYWRKFKFQKCKILMEKSIVKVCNFRN